MATQKIDLGNVVGPKGATGAQGNGFYRANTKLNTGSTSVSRSLILPTGKALLLRDTIVDNNGLVFEVTEAAAASASTVKISYKTSLRQTYDEVSENIKGNFLSLEKDLYTEIPEDADLNDYQTKGCYKCLDSSYTNTLKNVPTGLLWGFKLTVEEITYDNYICQKIVENVTGNTFIRILEGTRGWHDWITNGVISVFDTISSLGITDLPCTTLEVFKALPDKSMAFLGVDQTSAISDLPMESGCLEITRISSIRYKIILYRSRGGDVPAIKGMYIATVNQALTQLTWEKIYIESDVANNGTTTVAGKIVDARYAKTLTDKINTLNSKTIAKDIDTAVSGRVEQDYGNISVVTTNASGPNAVSGKEGCLVIHHAIDTRDASTMFLHSMGYVKDNRYIGHVLSSGGGLKMATNAVGTVTVSVDGSSASSIKQVFIFIPQIDDAVKS